MTYKIPLTEMGAALYGQRDLNVERAVEFFVDRIGVDAWTRRRNSLGERFRSRLESDPRSTPIEGISVRDREDEIAWYLYLSELSISDPAALESDQASRVLPYVSAVGRKLDAILAIKGVEDRLHRLLREVRNQDPDQALFELLIGATYVEEGWDVEAVREYPDQKSPDFEIKYGLRRLEVECKRLSRRAEYTTLERDAWLLQWAPISKWLMKRHLQLIFTIEFEAEIRELPADFLLGIITSNFELLKNGSIYSKPNVCTVSAMPVESERIAAHMATGAVLRDGRLLATNSLRHRIFKAHAELRQSNNHPDRLAKARQLAGRLNAAAFIEPAMLGKAGAAQALVQHLSKIHGSSSVDDVCPIV